MFVLGFHFPAAEGNKIAIEKVVKKVDEALGNEMSKVKEIKIFEGSNKSSKVELKTTLTSTDSFLAKALVHYFIQENDAKTAKYMIYTNKYQISELSKELDKGNPEVEAICKFFDGMDPVHVDVTYK